MSSYIDHYEGRIETVPIPGGAVAHRTTGVLIHSWDAFTDARLAWLYGPAHDVERAAASIADLEAWNRLGTRRVA
ncbi:hypothetical protein [Phenylobacterium sp.]|uniref:hypothetical protein n=1 Tax=Phenylobacterium sp. TaxID=1871053 RepID=UPI00393E07D5